MSEFLLSESSVGVLQRTVDGVNRIVTGLDMSRGLKSAAATYIHGWIGIIQSTGPTGQAQATSGGLYWVANATVSIDSTTGIYTVTARTSSDPLYVNVQAVNIAEIVSASETLQVGAIVYIVETPNSPLPGYLIVGAGGNAGFLAQIGAATSISTNVWSYAFSQVKTGSTAGSVQTVTGGLSGTAYNTAEVGDPATGVVSSGWNTANFASGVTLQAIRTGAVVWIQSMPTCGTPPTGCYWFTLANVVDGSCSP